MTNEDIQEVLSKGQADGSTLYRAAASLYKVLIVFNYLFAVLGLTLTFMAAKDNGFGPALGIFFAASLVCGFIYAFAVFASYVAKVLVHVLFSNLVLLQRGEK